MSTKNPKNIPENVREMFKAWGRTGGLSGGKRRAQRLSPARRKAIAKKAAAARWRKKPS